MVRSMVSEPSFIESKRRLLALCKNNETNRPEIKKWNKDAIRYLIKKLKKRPELIEELEKAITLECSETKCILIPKTPDYRSLVSHRRARPQVIYCRMWRWPELQSHHQIEAIRICQDYEAEEQENKPSEDSPNPSTQANLPSTSSSSFNQWTTESETTDQPKSQIKIKQQQDKDKEKQQKQEDTVCINPYHYQKRKPSPLEPVLVPLSRIPPDLSTSFEDSDPTGGTKAIAPSRVHSRQFLSTAITGATVRSLLSDNSPLITQPSTSTTSIHFPPSQIIPSVQPHPPPSTQPPPQQPAPQPAPTQQQQQQQPQVQQQPQQHIQQQQQQQQHIQLSPTQSVHATQQVPMQHGQPMNPQQLSHQPPTPPATRQTKLIKTHQGRMPAPHQQQQLQQQQQQTQQQTQQHPSSLQQQQQTQQPPPPPPPHLQHHQQQQQQITHQQQAQFQSPRHQIQPVPQEHQQYQLPQYHQQSQFEQQPQFDPQSQQHFVQQQPPQQHQVPMQHQQQVPIQQAQVPLQGQPLQQIHPQQVPMQHQPQAQQVPMQQPIHYQQMPQQAIPMQQQQQHHMPQQPSGSVGGQQQTEIAQPYQFKQNKFSQYARAITAQHQPIGTQRSYDRHGNVVSRPYTYAQHLESLQKQQQQYPPVQGSQPYYQQQSTTSSAGAPPQQPAPGASPHVPSQYQSTSSTYKTIQPPHHPYSSHEQAMEVSQEIQTSIQGRYYQAPPRPHYAPGGPVVHHHTQSLPIVASKIDPHPGQLAIDFQEIPFIEGTNWCSVSYHEYDRRLGDKYHAHNYIISVDGYTNPDCADRFCIGGIPNVHRTTSTEWVRRRIGRGVRMSYVDGEVYVECLCDSSIFVSSPLYGMDELKDDFSERVQKLYSGQGTKVFSNPLFSRLLSRAVSKGFEAVYKLTQLCTFRVSFVKGWGRAYKRQSIVSAPCWIEIQLNGPLQWIDRVLRQMKPPQGCGSTS